MIKEIKYLLYLLVILLFIFFSVRFYVSNDNKKNYFRSISQIDEKIKINEQNIVILTSDTEDIIEYVDLNKNNKKDEFKFFELLQKN